MAKGPSVDVVREVVSRGVHGRITSLEAWMTENYAALVVELQPKRLNWQALADRLSEENLTNAQGGKLTAHTARKTWQRVRNRAKTRTAPPARPVIPMVAREVPDPTIAPSPGKKRLQFKPISMRTQPDE